MTFDRMLPLLEGSSDSYKVKLDLNGNNMHLEAVCKELGDIEDVLPITKAVSDYSFKVDARSMIDICRVLEKDDLMIKLADNCCLITDPSYDARYLVLLAS